MHVDLRSRPESERINHARGGHGVVPLPLACSVDCLTVGPPHLHAVALSYHVNDHQHTLTADFSRSFYRTHKHECTSAGTVTNLLSAYPQARTAMSPKPTTHDNTDVHSCLGNHTFEPVQES